MTEDYREVPLSKLQLDPNNPRLSRELHSQERTPDGLLVEFAKRYNLIELARSIADKGFTPRHAEALLVVEEPPSSGVLIAVEGNRRLATLLLLKSPQKRKLCKVGAEWNELAEAATTQDLDSVPVIIYPHRAALDDYLGFRHITGPTPWRPEAKARFIDKLLTRNLSVREIARRIGSNRPTVRRYAEAYAVFEQAATFGIDVQIVEVGFGVFYNALSYEGVREFIGLSNQVLNDTNPQKYMPDLRNQELVELVSLLFGDDEKKLQKVISESRDLGKLNLVLKDSSARANLLMNRDLERAWRATGGGKDDLIALLRDLYMRLAGVNGQGHEYRQYADVKEEVERVYGLVNDMAERYGVDGLE